MSKQILFEEFQRMQKLAGIKSNNNLINDLFVECVTEFYLYENYYSKGILKENLSENILKKAKEKISNWLTKNEIKPTEGYLVLLVKKLIKLAKKIGIKDPENVLQQIVNLPPDQRTPEYVNKIIAPSINEVENDETELDYTSSLVGGVSGTYDDLSDTVKDQETGSVGTRSSEKVNKGAFALLSLFLVKVILAAGLTFPSVFAKAENTSNPPKGTESGIVQNLSDKNQETINKAFKVTKDNFKKLTPTEPSNKPSNTDPHPVTVDKDTKTIKTGFDIGEYKITDSDKDDIAKKIAQSILDGVPDGKQIDSGTIDPIGVISDTPGDSANDNTANDGSKDLKEKRLQTAIELWPDIVKALKTLDPNGKKIPNPGEIKLGKGKTEIGGKAGKEGDKSIQTLQYKTDFKYKDIPKPKPEPKKSTPTAPPDVRREQPPPIPGKPDSSTGNVEPTLPPTPTPPLPTGKEGIIYFTNNIKSRNNQIAFVLSSTDDKLSIYKELGEKDTNIPDGEYNNIISKGEYKGKKVSEKAIKLAKTIVTSRKSPDTFINAYVRLIGPDIKKGETRRQASITTGAKGKSTNAPIKENNISLIKLLTEAEIDNLFTDNGITVDTISNKKAYLTKLINTMYYGEKEGNVINIDAANNEFKEKYNALPSPLGSKEKGERYVYLDKLQNKNKTQPDVTRVTTAIEKDSQFKNYLNKIDTVDELANFILALFLHTDKNNNSLFDKKTFATDTGKVRSALFGLNNRIPNKIEEEIQSPENIHPDVKKAYDRVEQNTTLKNLILKINTLEEFYQLVLRSILPFINSKFKTQDGVASLKSAIVKASNSAPKYKNLLDKK